MFKMTKNNSSMFKAGYTHTPAVFFCPSVNVNTAVSMATIVMVAIFVMVICLFLNVICLCLSIVILSIIIEQLIMNHNRINHLMLNTPSCNV